MVLDSIYTREQQEAIAYEISSYCKKHSKPGLSNHLRYFRPMARDHDLVKKIIWQINAVRGSRFPPESLPDMQEIASLFLVDRASVVEFFKKQIRPTELYDFYRQTCLVRGREKGGKNRWLTANNDKKRNSESP